jgi:23S rRNA G2445 N2-methylase RlmL
MKACLWSRIGMRVLLELGQFRASNADELYTGARAIEWAEHLDVAHTLAVSATVRDNAALSHSGFAALKVKDAVVDALRDRFGGRRPDVDVKDPDVAIALHLRGSEAHVYLDLAGEPLHRRGYRVAMTEAPLKETLAAAVLALGGASVEQPFVDPMTGSGTLAIEQAWKARRIAPGLRRSFAFQRWPSQAHAAAFAALVEEARAAIQPAAPAPIIARDASPTALAAARRNAEAAGVAADITFEQGDARTFTTELPPGTLCLNPPYGERLEAAPDEGRGQVRRGQRPPAERPHRGPRFEPRARVHAQEPPPSDEELAHLYEDLGRLFASLPGWRVVVLSGSPLFGRVVLRKPAISHRLWNGPIEARLLVYAVPDRRG